MRENRKKHRSNRRIELLIASLALILAVTISAVIAYYTNSDKNNNEFTVGDNENKIIETFNPPDNQENGSNRYLKEVSVQNTGSVDCYVRLYVDFSDSEIMSYSKLSDDENLTDTTQFYAADPSAESSFANYLNNKTDGKWIYVSAVDDSTLGGYYYYTVPVAPGKFTESLFKWVDTTYNSATDIRQYEVLVYSETVQICDGSGNTYSDDALNPAWKKAWNDFLVNS